MSDKSPPCSVTRLSLHYSYFVKNLYNVIIILIQTYAGLREHIHKEISDKFLKIVFICVKNP